MKSPSEADPLDQTESGGSPSKKGLKMTDPKTRRPTDVQTTRCRLYFLPVVTRVPLKFGKETLTAVDCVRVALTVTGSKGTPAEGWGETPLSVQWAWPGKTSIAERNSAMQKFCVQLAEAWTRQKVSGHPIEIGHAFLENTLPRMLEAFNASRAADADPMPHLAALICCS
ncbi:MAG: hypothetical protein U1E27_00960, partial [Kiritimatiellia bacterium]|nr:hypothetical protein [Kiritimatiellia bacterium]